MEAVIARSVQVLAALGGAYLLALWFVLVVWTFRDIETRSKSVLTQIFSTLLVVLFFVPGVLLYMILRPKETLDVAFQRSLEEEYLLQDLEELPLCRNCQHYVEDDFMLCPHCQTQLREACVACSRLVDLRWTICPYCSTEQPRTKEAPDEKVQEPAARWVAPAALRRRALRQLPVPSVAELPSGANAGEQPAPAAMAAGETENGMLPPVRLFDRRKTREASRLNGYRRPVVVNGNGTNGNGNGENGHGTTLNGATLVDRFGRMLDNVDGEVAVESNGSSNGNGHRREESPQTRVAAVKSEEAGD